MNKEQKTEECNNPQVSSVVETWLKGEEFEMDGYGDLGLTLKQSAIKKALTLGKELRKKIADILFPIK